MCSSPPASLHVVDEVGRRGQPDLVGAVVEHLERARARHEVDAVAAEIGMRPAGTIVEDERAWRGGQRALGDVAREADTVTRGIERQAGREEALAEARAAHVDADLGEQPHRFVGNPLAERVVEHAEGGTHAEIETPSTRPLTSRHRARGR